jgi:hypothetical protein
MVSLEKIDYTHPRYREILNTMRQNQQVVYDSDVFVADGVSLDPKYLSICRRKERLSDWRFGKQRVNGSHLCLWWQEALRQLALNGWRHRSLDKFEHFGHKRWDWRFCPAEDVIYHIDYTSDVINLYSSEGRGRQKVYQLTSSTSIAAGTVGNQICTVSEVEEGKIKLLSYTSMAPPSILPENFIDVLEKWGHTWI